MVAIAGLRGTGDWGTDERPKNFRESILWLDPNGEAPLTALMSRMSTESVDDAEFSWFEETQGHVRLTVNGALADSATTVVVDAGALDLVAGDVLLVETDNSGQGELIEVSANPSTDTSFDVTREVAGSTAVAGATSIPDGANLTKIGNVHAEGSGAPKATTRNPTKLTNYAQIFKTIYDISGTALETRLRTGDPLMNDKKRKMFDHARDQELSYLFGRAYEDTSGSEIKWYTGGLNSFINTNRTLFTSGGTAFSQDNLIDALSVVFDYNGEGAGNERLAFCGNGALTAINKLINSATNSRINFDGVVRQWGMELHRLLLPQGRVFLRTHPLFNVHGRFTNSIFVINPRGIIYRPMKNRDTKFKDNIQGNDEDRKKGQWLTQAGIEVHHERTMAYLGGVSMDNA